MWYKVGLLQIQMQYVLCNTTLQNKLVHILLVFYMVFIISDPFDKINKALLINVISVGKNLTVCCSDNTTHNLLKNDFHCVTFTM